MGRTVAADDDLLLRVVQRVEGVEELVLRAFLARHELDVVDEQHVDAAIARSEIEDAIEAHGVDHLVHETLGRDVGQHEPGMMLHDVVADRVHQVRLAEADAAVNEQRVIRARRRFRNRAARGMRKLVRRSDDERVEGVAGNQAAGALRLRASSCVRLARRRRSRIPGWSVARIGAGARGSSARRRRPARTPVSRPGGPRRAGPRPGRPSSAWAAIRRTAGSERGSTGSARRPLSREVGLNQVEKLCFPT